MIADISSDTVYRLTKNGELTPLIVRTPSVHSSEPRTVWTAQLTTDKFIFLLITTLDFEAAKKRQGYRIFPLIHEFETGETGEVRFVDDDFPTQGWSSGQDADVSIVQKNVAARLIDAGRLKDAYEEKKLKGKLEKLVETLDEEDNPIVMIVKFKLK